MRPVGHRRCDLVGRRVGSVQQMIATLRVLFFLFLGLFLGLVVNMVLA